MPGFQSKYWCFTLNNYTEDDVASLRSLEGNDLLSYCVAGRELGDVEATPHLQGYLELNRKKTLAGVKQLLSSNRYHLEPRKGSAKQAQQYAKKDGDIAVEFGSFSAGGTQGSRSDLSAVKAILDRGGDLREVAEEHFGTFVRCHKALSLYASLLARPRGHLTVGFFLYGETGSGKSRLAHQHSIAAVGDGKLVHWQQDSRGQWFDGLAPYHRAIVWDDITPASKPPVTLLLRLLDRYPMKVPVKGGFVEFCAEFVYFTSNYSLDVLYDDAGDSSLAAIKRRFDHIQEININN